MSWCGTYVYEYTAHDCITASGTITSPQMSYIWVLFTNWQERFNNCFQKKKHGHASSGFQSFPILIDWMDHCVPLRSQCTLLLLRPPELSAPRKMAGNAAPAECRVKLNNFRTCRYMSQQKAGIYLPVICPGRHPSGSMAALALRPTCDLTGTCRSIDFPRTFIKDAFTEVWVNHQSMSISVCTSIFYAFLNPSGHFWAEEKRKALTHCLCREGFALDFCPSFHPNGTSDGLKLSKYV